MLHIFNLFAIYKKKKKKHLLCNVNIAWRDEVEDQEKALLNSMKKVTTQERQKHEKKEITPVVLLLIFFSFDYYRDNF